MLTSGNSKLGKKVCSFSLPSVRTCPGRTSLCERVCYASQDEKRYPHILTTYERNLLATEGEDFVKNMVREIRTRRARLVRIHASGDFYSPLYVMKWHAIAVACPGVRFWTYSRSWRAGMVCELVHLGQLPNVTVWLSADEESGAPDSYGLPVAWMQTEETEPEGFPDLIFRTRNLRKIPRKRVGLALVCPAEQTVEKTTTCESCGVCWK